MAILTIKDETLIAIGDAIRTKTGKTDLIAPGDMPAEIEGIESGGGGADLPEEAFNVSGNCYYRFGCDGWNWFIDNYGNKVKTEGITNCEGMFSSSSNLTSIPFTINCVDNTETSVSMNLMFNGCNNLTQLPAMGKVIVEKCNSMLTNCRNLREIPEDFCKNWDFSYMEKQTSGYIGSMSSMFSNCYSLRKVPIEMIRSGNPNINSGSSYLSGMCSNCNSLDELVNLPLYFTITWTSNALGDTVNSCSRLKRLTFETNEDGTPKVMNWKSQTIDLSSSVGYALSLYSDRITNYNSGITTDKKVSDDATYQALKNDPDWFTLNVAYSRYNHDSAVETINSLPDTSAYLATVGGTNTIKFKGAAGSATDGGAINTLTEEEIAVAASRGWTVTLS